MASLQLHVESGTGDGPRHDARLTQDLAQTLRRSPANSIDHPRTGEDEGTKGDVVEWANLIVTFTGGLPILLGVIRSWRSRSRNPKVTIELGSDRLVLDGVSPDDERRVIDAFLAKHADKE